MTWTGLSTNAIDERLGELSRHELYGHPVGLMLKKSELTARRHGLNAEHERLADASLPLLTESTIAAVVRIASPLHDRFTTIPGARWYAEAGMTLPPMSLEEKRQLLRQLRLRVEVVDRDHVRVHGVLDAQLLAISSRSSTHQPSGPIGPSR